MSVFAVFDTNVLVSALLARNKDSAVVLAMEALLSGKVTPMYNDEIISEYKNVLHREKFSFPKELIDCIIGHIEKNGLATVSIHTNECLPDPKDAVFYEVALSKENAFLVTGNIKHFPKTATVLTPREFIDRLSRI